MSVFGLHVVELVSQRQVVFVPLLNLEDLCLQLGDEQVFLVTGQMHAVVVLCRGVTGKWGRVPLTFRQGYIK